MRSLISAYYQVKEDGWPPLPVMLNVTEISQIVAANRSSVSILLSEWADLGLVRREGRMIILHGKLLKQVYDWVSLAPDDPSVPVPRIFDLPDN